MISRNEARRINKSRANLFLYIINYTRLSQHDVDCLLILKVMFTAKMDVLSRARKTQEPIGQGNGVEIN